MHLFHDWRNTRSDRRARFIAGGCWAVIALAAWSPLRAEDAAADGQKLEPIVVGTPERIEVFPPNFKLSSSRAEMHLAVTGFYAGGGVQDLTRAAEFVSTNDQVVKIVGGIAKPAANGQAEIVVRVGGQELKAPVEVAGQEAVERVSFNYGTLAALSKQGCNSGACHGSPSGKGGFRMSLRAYDPAVDTLTLVREAYNRRTNVYEPEASLLLQKPLMEVAHGGGRRLRKSDPSYVLLRDWIAQGCQVDPADAPTCVKVEVYPRQRILHRPAHTQQMVVLGHFSDGTVRDITSLAAFSSSDEGVATVDETGLVIGQDRGEAAILVRYLEKIETAYMMFLKEVPGFQWNNPPEQNYVDKFVFEKLRQLQILPSDLCTDEEFVRRIYLDVIGELPATAEVQAFLADQDAQKRAKLIDALLERPEYADFWALKWSDLLRLRNNKVTASGVPKFYRWIVHALRTNMPYDQFARELLTADGSTFENPPANFFRTATDTNDCTETTSQLFLGIRIQCAKCHNHPFERWTQDNYYGIGAFFNRVQRKASAEPDELVVWVARAGEVTQPRTGKQMKPWLPLTGDAELPGEDDRRNAFADWLVKPDNPFFAKVEVNRIWGHLLGRGVVEPVDDFRDSNPPSSAALLDALAKDFVEHGYDRKHVLRTILNSRTYQLSSRKNDFNKTDTKYFSHSRTRLLSAEQLLDAICQVTSVPEKYAGLPAGTRATQLPSPDVDNYFLKVFGQPARETACQCERSSESNLSQALQMINGPLVHGKVRDENNRLRVLLKAGKSNQEIISELYLAAFARPPSEPEMTAAVNHITASGDQVRGLEDVCWALLNANEFLFQHYSCRLGRSPTIFSTRSIRWGCAPPYGSPARKTRHGNHAMRKLSYRVVCLAFVFSVVCRSAAFAQEPPAASPAPVSFAKEIAPILLKKCQACHGQNDPKGGYQLINFTALMKPGDSSAAPATPMKLEESEIFRLVSSQDKDERMPKDADPLPAEQIALIKRWIEEGAKFDGPDANAALASLVPKGPHPAAPQAYRVAMPITAVAFRPDGQELAVGGYHEITIWNPATGALVRRIGDVDQRTYGLAYNKEGALLAAASGTPGVSGEVKLFDPNTGAVVKDLGSLSQEAFDVAFNPAGTKLAACSADRSIRIFDVASGAQDKLIEDHADWVVSIAWNHDGTRLASASRDKTSKVFDAATGDSLATFPGHGDTVYSVSFSPDGALIYSAGANKQIHIWKPADGAKTADIGGFGGDVFKVLVLGDMVYSCSADKTARQHKTADRAQVRSFNGHTDWVYCLAVNEPTKRMATGSFDGEVRVWNLDDGNLVIAFKAAPGLQPAPAATAAAAK